MKTKTRIKAPYIFIFTLILILAILTMSVMKTNKYNQTEHHYEYMNGEVFSENGTESEELSLKAGARSSTWKKIFDLNNEGLTEENYEAFTYDFVFANNTADEVKNFTFKLTFSRDVFLASAWNGALEIHQKTAVREKTAVIPDLREFNSEDYDLDFVTFDGETFVSMKSGDYFVYIPSSSQNAMEVPIEPHENTVPGLILYAEIGETISDSAVTLDYTFHRVLRREPLFWGAVAGLFVWLVSLVIYIITLAEIRKYNARHERDNEIIEESIETFTGFIDAKDPYTNGHSKRVATYTKRIAQEMGYEGEELDRIYYIALLHDCGKIGVPDNILGKPGRLTKEEFEVIKSHTTRGGEILRSFKSLESAEEGALYHHERYDGGGYPSGKAGTEIPLIGRIICVADSFDAMNTDRVYRKRLSKEQIISEIETNKGKQFDPKIADIMLSLIRSGEIPVGD